jgi:hypothetical protein
MDISRRSFLQLIGAAVTLSAGGIALLDAKPIIKTYFLPPRCGWNAGTWELILAQEALRIVTDKLGMRHATVIESTELYQVEAQSEHQRQQLERLLASRARLVERCDKLARGWIPTRRTRTLYDAAGVAFQTVIHG